MDKRYHISYHSLTDPIKYGNTLLTQLGVLYCTPSMAIETHAHLDWYELTVVTGGEGVVITNDIPTKVSEGDIYLSYPGDFHRIESSKTNPLKYNFFSFNTKNSVLKKELRRISNAFSCTERVFRDPQVSTTVSYAISEITSNNMHKDELLNLLFEQILFYTARNFDTPTQHHKDEHITSADEICFQIMHYIDTHIYSIKNLSALSEKFSYNYSYLSKLFKNTTGNTITAYYQTRRLEAAKLLIIEGRLKIIEIAEMLNYSSLYAFSKAFKNNFGVSPKHYIK